jgi:hypothetical protein
MIHSSLCCSTSFLKTVSISVEPLIGAPSKSIQPSLNPPGSACKAIPSAVAVYVEAVDPEAGICADAKGTPDVNEGRPRDKLVEICAKRSHEHTKETDQRSDISGVHIFYWRLLPRLFALSE